MSRKPTISEIEYAVRDSSPYFFSKKSLQFFGQKKSSFTVYAEENGKFMISAPMKCNGRLMGYTRRLFNPKTNKLELVPK